MISTACRTLAHNDALVKEAQHALIALNPFTFSNQKPCVPAFARRFLFTLGLSMLACEAEDSLFSSTFRTLGPDHASEVTFLGTRVVLDGQLQRNYPTSRTPGRSEKVIVVWITISSYALFGECFQIRENAFVFHFW